MSLIRKTILNIVSIVVMLTTLVAATPVMAATVSAANDYTATLQTGIAANHEVVFTTPTGAAEGTTITIGFDTAFDTSTLTENDVDVEDDGVDLTTAPNCTGAEEAGVAIAGDTVTVTICAGDGGAIAATSVVTVRIGTNATASGTGANRVVNPVSEGTYYVSIAGSLGDSGSIALPIDGDDSISVTATVPAAGGGGGGGIVGGGGAGDVIPPLITNVMVINLTETSATITWNTDENADSKVDYGTTVVYVDLVTDSGLVPVHSLDLTGLSPGTTYHFRVRSADSAGNESASGDFTFTTPDQTMPVISNVRVVDITETTARVLWNTNEPATSVVNYGTTAAYGGSVADATLVTSHSMLLTGLTADTVYHFLVRSTDASGNAAQSSDSTFTTTAILPLTSVVLTVTPGNALNTLTWINPPAADIDGVRILSCLGGFPSGPTDPNCMVVFDGLGESFVHTGLINDTTYYYGVYAYAYDRPGQFASGALGSGTPRAPEEEVPPEEVPPVEVPPPVVPPPDEVPPGTLPPIEPPPGVVPPTTVPSGELVPLNDIELFVARGTIQLTPTQVGVVHMLVDRRVTVELNIGRIVKPIERVQLTFGASVYSMTQGTSESSYMADVLAPDTVGRYAMAVSLFYEDGTTQTISLVADVEPNGIVYEMIDGERKPVANATVTVLQVNSDPVAWDGSPYGQFNPVTTSANGTFGWYVPNGTYRIRVQKAGYETFETASFAVSDNIVNASVRLIRLPEEEIVIPPEGIAGVLNTVTQRLEEIRAIPEVQTAATATLPVLAVVAVASLIVLATSFSLLPLLQYLVTAPILFFWKRKRKTFGVVYNAISKVPIGLATVRFYQAPTEAAAGTAVRGRLMGSRVTDKGGRYFFLAQPGRYVITATMVGFTFPSTYLADVKDDGMYLDVYHGEPIEVTDKDAVITANIPLDPIQAGAFHEPKRIRRLAIFRRVQSVVAVLGIVLSIVVAIIQPSTYTFAMVGVQIIVYLLARRLARVRKPKSWGIVYDKQTGRPLASVVARIFEPRYNKLLETMVTDSKGRYTALLGQNQYYVVFEKSGFESHEVRPVDYTGKSEPAEFGMNIKLSPSDTQPKV